MIVAFVLFVAMFGVAGTFLSIEARRRYEHSVVKMGSASPAPIRLGRVVREAE